MQPKQGIADQRGEGDQQGECLRKRPYRLATTSRNGMNLTAGFRPRRICEEQSPIRFNAVKGSLREKRSQGWYLQSRFQSRFMDNRSVPFHVRPRRTLQILERNLLGHFCPCGRRRGFRGLHTDASHSDLAGAGTAAGQDLFADARQNFPSSKSITFASGRSQDSRSLS